MKKLELNKKTMEKLNKREMANVSGGFEVCISSCDRGTEKGKNCCKNGGWTIVVSAQK